MTRYSDFIIEVNVYSYRTHFTFTNGLERIVSKKIIGYEFKHSSYVVSQANQTDDAVIIKERIHYDDNTTEPNIRIIRNFQKPFYVVRDSYRTFKQKRAWIPLEWCREYKSNQRQLKDAAARALKMGTNGGMKIINRNPFIAGTDVSPQVLLKHKYRTKYPDLVTYNTTCHLDIETDMNTKERAINMVSVSMGDHLFQAVVQSFLGTIQNPVEKIMKKQEEEIIPLLLEGKLKKCWKKYCKENGVSEKDLPYEKWYQLNSVTLPVKRQDIKLETEVIVVNTPAKAVVETFKRVHKWKPDILSIWNLPFDLGNMTKALEKEGYDPKDIYCDPCIPRDLRYFNFREGAAKIEDANGKAESKDPWDRWHAVTAPSSFFWADQMSVRRFVRRHLSKEPSYSLGSILEKELGHGKLKGDDLTNSTGADWHRDMQANHKIFYCVYNQWDNLGAQQLDEATLDLCFTFPNQCQFSELQSYGSQGRKLGDDLYFFLLEQGFVLSGVSDQMETEMDKHSVSLEGWICTLAAHLIHHEMGRKVLTESGGVFTKIVKLVLDIDVKSSYPSTGVWMNIARDTIYRVMCSMAGIDFEQQRRAGINLPSGRVNAIDIGTTICNMPRPVEWMRSYERKIGYKREVA